MLKKQDYRIMREVKGDISRHSSECHVRRLLPSASMNWIR